MLATSYWKELIVRSLLRSTALAALLCASSVAALAASPETVSYKSGSETVSAGLYLPSGHGPFPALVVIHEWWGVTPWVRQQAENYAGHGYASLVIDLYRGRSTNDPNEAHELMRGVPQDRAMRDLKAAVDYLQSRKDIRKDHIGDIGWCMGGGYALQLAVADVRLRTAAAFYGPPPTDEAAIRAMHAEVVGSYGAQDRGIPPSAVETFEKTLQAAGKHPDIKVYPDAGHAFENPDNKASYRPADTEDANSRTLQYLERNLKH